MSIMVIRDYDKLWCLDKVKLSWHCYDVFACKVVTTKTSQTISPLLLKWHNGTKNCCMHTQACIKAHS